MSILRITLAGNRVTRIMGYLWRGDPTNERCPGRNKTIASKRRLNVNTNEDTIMTHGVRVLSRGRLFGGTVYTISRKPDNSKPLNRRIASRAASGVAISMNANPCDALLLLRIRLIDSTG